MPLLKRNFFLFVRHGNAVKNTVCIFFPKAFPDKEQPLDHKPGNQKRQIQYDLQKRHILINHINIVSRRMAYFKLIVS